MLAVFLRFIKDKRNSLFGFALSSAAFLEMYVSLFPFIKEQSQQLEAILKTYPEGFMKAFGIESSNIVFSRLESYLSTEQFSFIWPILLIIFAVSLANSIAVNDIEKGTIEFAASLPISRIKFFLARYLGGIFNLFLFVLISNFSLIPFAALHDATFSLENLIKLSFVGFLFGVMVLTIGSFFSVLFSEKGKTSFVVGGLILLAYIANIVSTLKETFSNLKYLSPFYYFNPSTIFMKGEFLDYTFVFFVGVTVVFFTLALFWYRDRDLTS